jgi:arginase
VNKQVTLIYVPLYLGGSHRGAALGPAAMKVADLRERIKACGWQIAKEVEVSVPESAAWFEEDTYARCLPEIIDLSKELAKLVEAALDAGTLPITIGGDHSLAIGTIAGSSNYFRKRKESFGLLWFDAHGDINTPETSQSGNVHGMPLAICLGHGPESVTQLNQYSPKAEASLTALVGIRDLDPPELEMITRTGIAAYNMSDIDKLGIATVVERVLSRVADNSSGIHLSFDIDVLDPEIAPGVSTVAKDGIGQKDIMQALSMIAKTGLVRSIDMVELNPTRDIQNRTAEIAVDMIAACLSGKA